MRIAVDLLVEDELGDEQAGARKPLCIDKLEGYGGGASVFGIRGDRTMVKPLDVTEIYKQAFETWRFQVESYWTRNTYFAGFEVAAVAGVWLVSAEHHWSAAFASLAAIVLTAIWWLSSDRQHEYITYWWEKLVELDEVVVSSWARSMAQTEHGVRGDRPVLLASDVERWRTARRGPLVRIRYSMLVLSVQALFFFVWLYLFGYNLTILRHSHWPVGLAAK